MDQQIANLLLATLSPDANTRSQAETGLAELQRNGEAGLSLARICLAQDADLALRQSAGINLRKYTKEHWSIAFETFKGDPPEQHIKDQIRQAVFSGLSDPNRKIRLACASVVSEIAGSDYPDEWPNLLDALVQLLASGQSDSVHGAMRVMTDFVSSDLSEDQLLPLASTILPRLLLILGDQQKYSSVTRSQAVSVFNQCLSTLYMVKENHPQAATYATTQVLPEWVAAFGQILNSDPISRGIYDSLFVRNEIFQTLSTILVSFPKSLSKDTPALLLQAVQHLTVLAQPFRTNYLNDSLDNDFSLESEDGTTLTLPLIASNIFLYIASAARKPAGKTAFIDKTSNQPTELFRQVMHLALHYAQITTEDEESWSSDVNTYVADEDEDIPAATVRTAALDLASGFANTAASATIEALSSAVERTMQESARLQAENQEDWWKGYESCLSHLASLAEELEEQMDDAKENGRPPAFNLESAFDKLVMPFLNRPDVPFLQGRALIFASRFATHLPPHVQQQFFESSLQAFESQDAGLVVKISALRALKNFCQQVPDSPAFASLGNRITTNLLPLVSQTTEATLVLILETLQRILPLGSVQQDRQLCFQLAEALLQPVINGSTIDPLLSASLSDLMRSYSASTSPYVFESLVQIVLPKIAEILNMPESDETRPQIDSSMVVLNAIFDGRPAQLGEGLFAPIAQAVFGILGRTEDDSVLQEGLECLTFVIRKDIDQLLQWHGTNGESGLSALFSIVARVLDPQRSESGGLFVGDLLLHVFRRAGPQILPILPDLLRALVLRLSSALTATFSQSLILPFAYLVGTQPDTALQMLEGIEVDGKNGMHLVLGTWCDLAESIQGFWNNRVSTFALSRLLLTQRSSLDQLQVRGDLIVKEGQGILTRSRSKKNPDSYTQIAFKTKALKLLLKELEQSTEPSAPEEAAIEDDLEGEDWEDDEAAEAAKGAIDLSHFIGADASFLEDDGDHDDDEEDLKTDPIYTMDMPHHLAETMRQFASQDRHTFEVATQQLSPAELHTLHSI